MNEAQEIKEAGKDTGKRFQFHAQINVPHGEAVTVAVLGMLGGLAMVLIPTEAKEIVIGVCSGLIGYLKGISDGR
ncbi:MAG: hypothetical protein LLG06_05940, partial [Desulfobacteraceae bacterium]|nr:hypothetical protein [Desulfobacteraceae bacterium]